MSKTPPPQFNRTCAVLMQRFATGMDRLASSALTALTSLRIATHLKRHGNVGCIICDSIKNATAAASVRDLEYDFAIICAPPVYSDADIAPRLNKGLEKAVDLWLFASEAARNAWCVKTGTQLAKTAVAPGTGEIEFAPMPSGEDNDPTGVAIFGPLCDAQILQNSLRAVLLTKVPGRWHVNVYGSGKAADVMPVVKWARRQQQLDITWHGEDADTAHMLDNRVILPAALTPGPTAIAAMRAGLQLIQTDAPETTAAALDGLDKTENTDNKNVAAHCFHVEQLHEAMRRAIELHR